MTEEKQATFAAAASQWWSVAAQWLGWRAPEFWQATPAEPRVLAVKTLNDIPRVVGGPVVNEEDLERVIRERLLDSVRQFPE